MMRNIITLLLLKEMRFTKNDIKNSFTTIVYHKKKKDLVKELTKMII